MTEPVERGYEESSGRSGSRSWGYQASHRATAQWRQLQAVGPEKTTLKLANDQEDGDAKFVVDAGAFYLAAIKAVFCP